MEGSAGGGKNLNSFFVNTRMKSVSFRLVIKGETPSSRGKIPRGGGTKEGVSPGKFELLKQRLEKRGKKENGTQQQREKNAKDGTRLTKRKIRVGPQEEKGLPRPER